MSQRFLSILGDIARLSRQVGFAPLLGISRDLIDLFFMTIDRPPLRVEIDGLTLYGYLRHRSFLEGISTGRYEAYTRALYEKALQPDIIVVDGGAHIGLYSLLAARQVGTNGKVFAFEPDSYNFRALVFNIKKNNHSNVIPIQKALFNSSGDRFFYESRGTISGALAYREGCEQTHQGVYVQVTTLDDELRDLATDSILIKLDIEGSEPLALQGMSNILREIRSVVLIAELNPHALHHAGLSPKDLIVGLERCGFQVYAVDEVGNKLSPVVNTTALKKGNLYCIRAS